MVTSFGLALVGAATASTAGALLFGIDFPLMMDEHSAPCVVNFKSVDTASIDVDFETRHANSAQ